MGSGGRRGMRVSDHRSEQLELFPSRAYLTKIVPEQN